MTSKFLKPVILPAIEATPSRVPSDYERIFDAMADAVSKLINARPRSPTKAEIVDTLKAAVRRSRFQ
jgi:hypothetical protein